MGVSEIQWVQAVSFSVHCFSRLPTDTSVYCFGNPESKIVCGVVAEGVDVGIPALPRAYGEIAAALFVDHLVAGIFDGQLVLAAFGHRFAA